MQIRKPVAAGSYANGTDPSLNSHEIANISGVPAKTQSQVAGRGQRPWKRNAGCRKIEIETGVETRLTGLDVETTEVVQPECLAAKQRVLWETEVSILTRSQKRSRSGLLAEVLGLDTAMRLEGVACFSLLSSA